MDHKVLVTYVSANGSTQEIAEKIAAVLREQGLIVNLEPLREVKTLEGYGAVVMGAPLYTYHLLKDAHRFLKRHREVIEGGLPVAVFSGGPMGKGDEEEWQGVRAQLDKELAQHPWFKPAAVEVMGGRFDPHNLHMPWKLIPGLKAIPAVDYRDWESIRAWAEGLAEQFSSHKETA